MNRHTSLIHSKFYYIYNRGNNRENLFRFPEDYQHFLRLYDKYIEPIAETYAWCLLANHFHLLVKIKPKEEIGFLSPFYSSSSYDSGRLNNRCYDDLKWQLIPENEIGLLEEVYVKKLKRLVPFRQFSHLFNAYSKYVNSKYKRTGSLFEKNFRRICVENPYYFKQLVIYIHKNPQHHRFIDNFRHYPWSSYQSIFSMRPTKLRRKTVLGWFDDEARFTELHANNQSVFLDNKFFLEY